MTVSEAFAENLKRILDERGLSQKEFSSMSGIHVTSISGWIRKRYCPTLTLVWLVARALDITIDELVEGADE